MISSSDFRSLSKARRPRNTGSGLESLILASQSRSGVLLTKIPHGVKYIGGGKKIPVPAPVDFFGCFHGGHMLVFDAKSSTDPIRLVTDTTCFKEHQRLQLISFGELGATAGLLCECLPTRTLYWINWTELVNRKPSVAWAEMQFLGSAGMAIRWDVVRLAGKGASNA